MSTMDDKRTGIRVPFKTTIELISPDGKKVLCKSQNISLSGILLHVDDTLCLNQSYQLNIKLGLCSHSAPIIISIQGRVTRQKSYDVAFKFDSMDFDSYEHLKNLLKANSDGIPGVVEEIESPFGLYK